MIRRRKPRPGLTLAIGFMMIIAAGTVLLMLPASHQDGVDISLIDALFISTSAVCVTGLTPLDISQTLSTFGSTVLMLLIQAGGLGYAVLAVFFIWIANGRIDFFLGNLLRDSFGADHKINTGRLLRTALTVTIASELLGAVLLFTSFSREYDLARALYLSLFHSVSAFNNAGFDLFSTSMIPWNDDPVVLITIALLIITGGIGFLLCGNIAGSIRKKTRIMLHTKIVVVSTLFLIIAGTVLFKLTIDGIDWKNAFFQSVTTRTAGFFSFDQASMSHAAILISVILMFIGASPGGTGGGIKTTSAFAAILASFSLLLGRRPRAFGREIGEDSIMKAFFVIVIAITVLAIALMLLTVFQPEADLETLLFEAVSAFATVGLTLGITPDLTIGSKIVIIALMYLGRVGVMTIIASFARRMEDPVRYIEENILIG